jgi:16S rRNA (uracil1498-N3)-methyltransferase
VNLLLFEPGEVGTDGAARLDDRRAVHLRTVLRAVPGSDVRAGVIGGRIGRARVLADDGRVMDLAVTLDGEPPAPMPVDLVLAMPRPKVLSRALETAAAFGVRRVDVVNAWRVDKAYLASPRLAEARIDEHLRLGAEQGVTTHLPAVEVHHRLMPLLDARFVDRGEELRLLCHARGASPIERTWSASRTMSSTPLASARWGAARPIVLAIGPEGGWIEREVETFAARGFAVVSLGAPVLRVEVALAAALGQLALLLRS